VTTKTVDHNHSTDNRRLTL